MGSPSTKSRANSGCFWAVERGEKGYQREATNHLLRLVLVATAQLISEYTRLGKHCALSLSQRRKVVNVQQPSHVHSVVPPFPGFYSCSGLMPSAGPRDGKI